MFNRLFCDSEMFLGCSATGERVAQIVVGGCFFFAGLLTYID